MRADLAMSCVYMCAFGYERALNSHKLIRGSERNLCCQGRDLLVQGAHQST